MAKPILVANWKNHPSSFREAKALVGRLAKSRLVYKKLSLFFAVPAPYFEMVQTRVKSFAYMASQDIPSVSTGTHTSLLTPDILKSFGVKLSIIGHSERRALGETNKIVAEKVKVALSAGIVPLVCVGEKTWDDEGEHFEFLRNQLKMSLAGLNRRFNLSKIVIAYEPIWAIGKHARNAIRSTDLSQSVIFIRKVLTDMFGRKIAEAIPVLYGGSVEPSNAMSLLKETGIRGFLVGHASLDANDFKNIATSLITK